MDSTVERIWSEAKEQLKVSMNEISYKTWIAFTEAVCIDGSTFVLMADSEVAYLTLTRTYTASVTEAINSVSGGSYTVKFIRQGEDSIIEHQSMHDESAQLLNLNPKYTFDTFVVGESNRFAQAAAFAVAERPSDAYNPLFIYGGVGLGKTHLMHAIGHVIHERNNDAKIMYVTCESFTNELIQALREGKNHEFRQKYRNIDVLMVDDVQFLQGKTSTQDEFFHTFNALYASNKQIILTSDRPPHEIPTLQARMSSRFSCGLLADISQPDYETRAAILRKKAANEGITIDDRVLLFIADKVQSNIRELEGSLTRVMAHAELTGSKISIPLVEKVLFDMLSRNRSKRLTPEIIIQAVAEYYRITADEIKGRKRDRKIASARQVCMYLCRHLLDMSFEDIGEALGGKHYTTVMHGCERIQESIKNGDSPEIRTSVEDIEAGLVE